MKFTFDRAAFSADTRRIGAAAEQAAEEAMSATVRQAADDARGLIEWREPGEQAQQYGNTLWEWTTTGSAARSIQGYVVPRKRLSQFSTETVSRRNGVPRKHPHYTDDGVTDDHTAEPGTVVGIVTMNINYGPPLQEWEENTTGHVVTEEVFAANWDAFYVPAIIEPTFARVLNALINTGGI